MRSANFEAPTGTLAERRGVIWYGDDLVAGARIIYPTVDTVSADYASRIEDSFIALACTIGLAEARRARETIERERASLGVRKRESYEWQ
jgi:hypothetical protein